MGAPTTDPSEFGAPFPLLKIFVFLLLPMLVLAGLGLIAMMASGVSAGAEALFSRSQTALVGTMLPTAPNGDFIKTPGPAVLADLRSELSELGVTCLSVVSANSSYSVTVDETVHCAAPDLRSFRHELSEQGALLVEDLVLPGYWTSLGLIGSKRSTASVIVAVTQPAQSFEASISRTTGVWTSVMASLVVMVLLGMTLVVYRAQRRLDGQASYVRRVHDRLRSFLPMAAVRDALEITSTSQRFDAVVMFVDLRNFSSFAETAETEEVASLIDAFVTRTASAVADEGGEIDKIIGDAVLAVFSGKASVERAVGAAVACIGACRTLPRHPGIGLYRGEVIATAIGTADRADFSVLGRTVNLASRLCSIAEENEIVIPASIDLRGLDGVREVARELVRPRNHRLPEEVVRYRTVG